MRVAAFILTVLGATALVTGGVIVIAGQSPDPGWTFILATIAMSALVFAPVLLGSLLAYWDVRRSDAAAAFYRRWLLVLVAIEVAGAVAIFVYAAITHSPWWLPVVFTTVGFVLFGAALIQGRRCTGGPSGTTPSLPWEPGPPSLPT